MTGAWGGVHAVFEDPAGHAITLASVDPLTRELDAKRRADAEEAERDRRAAHELAWRRFCDASPSSAYASAIDIDYDDRRRRLR